MLAGAVGLDLLGAEEFDGDACRLEVGAALPPETVGGFGYAGAGAAKGKFSPFARKALFGIDWITIDSGRPQVKLNPTSRAVSCCQTRSS